MNFEAKFLRQAMSRGKVYVDDNLLNLPAELQKRNFKVEVVPKHMLDKDIKPLVSNERFITNNTKDYKAKSKAARKGKAA